jgi:hypothetical protein
MDVFLKFNHKVASVVKDRKEIQTKTIKSLKENQKIRTKIKINIFIECHFLETPSRYVPQDAFLNFGKFGGQSSLFQWTTLLPF